MKSKKCIILLLISFCVFVIVLSVYRNLYSKKSEPINQGTESQDMEIASEVIHNKEVNYEESEAESEEDNTNIETNSEDTQINDTPITDIEDPTAQTQETGDGDVQNAFYYTELSDSIKQYITGKSYPDIEASDTMPQISYDELAYVHVLYYDFEGRTQEGELICNKAIAQDLTEIFSELYDNCYPIEKIRLVDEYNADDEMSMADNNTSCFNYRTVPGRTKLSNHSYGRAIDINPLYNPYVRNKNGETIISPDNAAQYADRTVDFPYKIDKDDLCYKLFVKHGFTWGGSWNSSKDYQHFEKTE